MTNRKPFSAAFAFGALSIFLTANSYAEADVTPQVETNVVGNTAVAVSNLEGVSVLIDKTIKVMKIDVDAMADAIFGANQAMIPPESVEEAKADIRSDVLQHLTMQALLARECDREGITLTEEECYAYFLQVSGGRFTYEQAAEQSNMSIDDFRSFLMKTVRIDRLLESKFSDIPEVTDAEIRDRFDAVVATNPSVLLIPEQVEASHILVKVDDETSDEAAKTKIEDIRKKLLDGADFAETAMAFSDCPSKVRGGNLGAFGRGQMVAEFEVAAFTQDPGDIGEIVKTQFGYHIIRVESKQEAGQTTFEDVKDSIAGGLAREKFGQARETYFTTLREKAQIENLESPVVSEPVLVEPQSRELPEWAR